MSIRLSIAGMHDGVIREWRGFKAHYTGVTVKRDGHAAFLIRDCVFRSGLPMYCLEGTATKVASNATVRWSIRTAVENGQFTNDYFGGGLLPLRPIFPGVIINTLFYAAIWFGVFFGVAALRRFIRKKRGRCVKCSYDLRSGFAGEERGCPECGWGRAP